MFASRFLSIGVIRFPGDFYQACIDLNPVSYWVMDEVAATQGPSFGERIEGWNNDGDVISWWKLDAEAVSPAFNSFGEQIAEWDADGDVISWWKLDVIA